MKRKHTGALIGLVLLILTAAALFLGEFRQQSFSGRRVKKTDSYLLEARQMNGSDLHTMELDAGDALCIRFQTEKGSMHMEVMAPDGSSIYCGNGKEITDFTIHIPESGVYKIAVEAKHAKGSIQVGHSQEG